ncbi:MAG: Peroxisome biosynthesis protein pex1, partial [Watsoniomyces obsoletus]
MLGVEGLIGNIVRIEPAFRPLHNSSIQSLQLFPFVAESGQKKDGLKFGGESKAGRQATVDKLRLAHSSEFGLLEGPLTDGMVLPPSGEPTSATHFAGGILRFQQRGPSDHDSNDAFIWA